MQTQQLAMTIFYGLLSLAMSLGTLWLAYLGARAARERYKARKAEATFKAALELAAQFPPPAGFRPGDCIAIPVNPDDVVGKVRYEIVKDYSVIDLPNGERFWMLHCDDGRAYKHDTVITVPGGYPDQSDERSTNPLVAGVK